MGLASAAGNIYFVYSFIKRLATPFKSTKAFELGIIDENGKVLKKRSKLKTKEDVLRDTDIIFDTDTSAIYTIDATHDDLWE